MLGLKINSFELFYNLSQIYGPIFTFWMGPEPVVIISDLDVAKEAFLEKKNEIAGRPQITISKFIALCQLRLQL